MEENMDEKGFSIDLVFKPLEPGFKLHPEISQLFSSCLGEILKEIEEKEKAIIEAEKKAAEEITARTTGSKEGI